MSIRTATRTAALSALTVATVAIAGCALPLLPLVVDDRYSPGVMAPLPPASIKQEAGPDCLKRETESTLFGNAPNWPAAASPEAAAEAFLGSPFGAAPSDIESLDPIADPTNPDSVFITGSTVDGRIVARIHIARTSPDVWIADAMTRCN